MLLPSFLNYATSTSLCNYNAKWRLCCFSLFNKLHGITCQQHIVNGNCQVCNYHWHDMTLCTSMTMKKNKFCKADCVNVNVQILHPQLINITWQAHLHENGKSKFWKADRVRVNIQIFKYQLVKLVNDRVLQSTQDVKHDKSSTHRILY